MKNEERIQLLHPEGKLAPEMSLKTYKQLEHSIVNILKDGQLLSWTEIYLAVKEDFKKNKKTFKGSSDWYCEPVKLDMEARGRIKTEIIKGRKIHSLII